MSPYKKKKLYEDIIKAELNRKKKNKIEFI